jgi:hypothetical protein
MSPRSMAASMARLRATTASALIADPPPITPHPNLARFRGREPTTRFFFPSTAVARIAAEPMVPCPGYPRQPLGLRKNRPGLHAVTTRGQHGRGRPARRAGTNDPARRLAGPAHQRSRTPWILQPCVPLQCRWCLPSAHGAPWWSKGMLPGPLGTLPHPGARAVPRLATSGVRQGLLEHHGPMPHRARPAAGWPWPRSAAPTGAPLSVQRQHIEHRNRPA